MLGNTSWYAVFYFYHYAFLICKRMTRCELLKLTFRVRKKRDIKSVSYCIFPPESKSMNKIKQKNPLHLYNYKSSNLLHLIISSNY